MKPPIVRIACGLVGLAAAGDVVACAEPNQLIFSCTTTTQRVVEVCDAGDTLRYTFGRRGASPELALAIPRAAASTSQWSGVGRYETYTVNIPNGDTVYSLFWSVDRLSAARPINAGINVEVNGRHVRTIPCRANTARQRLQGINLTPSEE